MEKLYRISDLGRLAYMFKNDDASFAVHFNSWLMAEARRIADSSWARATADIIKNDRTDVLSEWENAEKTNAYVSVSDVLKSVATTARPNHAAWLGFCQAVADFDEVDAKLKQMKKKGFFFILRHCKQFTNLYLERERKNRSYTFSDIINIASVKLGHEFFLSFL